VLKERTPVLAPSPKEKSSVKKITHRGGSSMLIGIVPEPRSSQKGAKTSQDSAGCSIRVALQLEIPCMFISAACHNGKQRREELFLRS
jgi:hypothetical protein